ncbi:MAG: type II toxin-antitoxin system VapC family toxin [Spirochaetia bacterium]|nr:type II toxin-antitoxin system VapC family toxin [Spirochaetia bacterium]
MNGNRAILDTNALIYLLKGNEEYTSKVAKADWIGISFMTKIEFLSYPEITEMEKEIYLEFEKRITLIGFPVENQQFTKTCIDLRKKYKMKLPDAIIAGTAIYHDAILLTNDSIFIKVTELKSKQD